GGAKPASSWAGRPLGREARPAPPWSVRRKPSANNISRLSCAGIPPATASGDGVLIVSTAGVGDTGGVWALPPVSGAGTRAGAAPNSSCSGPSKSGAAVTEVSASKESSAGDGDRLLCPATSVVSVSWPLLPRTPTGLVARASRMPAAVLLSTTVVTVAP